MARSLDTPDRLLPQRRVALCVRPGWVPELEPHLAALESAGFWVRTAEQVDPAVAGEDWDGLILDAALWPGGWSPPAGYPVVLGLAQRSDPELERLWTEGAAALVPWPCPPGWLHGALQRALAERGRPAPDQDPDPGAGGGPGPDAHRRLIAAADAHVLSTGGDPAAAERWSRGLHRLGARAGGPWLAAVDPTAEGLALRWRRAHGGTLWLKDPSGWDPSVQALLAELLAQPVHRALPRPGVRAVAWLSYPELEGDLNPGLAYRLNALRADLGPSTYGQQTAPRENLRLDELERRHVEAVLTACGGNRSEAARRLGLHRATLHAKLRRWLTP